MIYHLHFCPKHSILYKGEVKPPMAKRTKYTLFHIVVSCESPGTGRILKHHAMYTCFPQQQQQQQKRSVPCDLLVKRTRNTSSMSFIHAGDQVRAALRHTEPTSTGSAAVHTARLMVCFGPDSGMIRTACMPHDFRTPITCFLTERAPIGSNFKPNLARITQPPRRTNQAPATQLLSR